MATQPLHNPVVLGRAQAFLLNVSRGARYGRRQGHGLHDRVAPPPLDVLLATRVLLLRHGLSTYNVQGRIQGRDDDSTLAAAGETMARRTGEALAGVRLDAVLSSPLRRAVHTAALVCSARTGVTPAVAYDDDLLEVELEPWSGKSHQQVIDGWPREERTWREHPEQLTLQRADGSSYRPIYELHLQARRFWRRLCQRHQGKTVLVVAHNAILRCVVLAALGLGPERFARLRMNNCALSVLNVQDGGDDTAATVQVESLNSTVHLDPVAPGPRRGGRILLLRHGETDWNRQSRFQGQIDVPLNATGRQQAQQAAAFLRHSPVKRAYTSPMARPRETAELVLAHHAGVPLVTCEGLLEIGHGLWEGKLEQDIQAQWPQLLATWKTAPHQVVMPGPGGETIQQVSQRAVAAMERIAQELEDGETALVVAHDAVNKAVLCHLLGLSPAHIWCVKQGNGGVSVIDYPEGGAGPAIVHSLNLTGHLGGVLDETAAGAL
ncbi:MAG: histidine phosphatase family protein [Synechococcus sp. SB0668_bin_15]|nr:histidine phosphatase family protein [Synechococcus sp. SB0668_bin_15]MYC49523.1 histidine phosphatase family protein [Synechococcus sp. SB0662_bin_14]